MRRRISIIILSAMLMIFSVSVFPADADDSSSMAQWEALSADEKAELLDVIENYRNGHVPLIVPVTLLNHYVRKYDQPYLKQQLYLHPHPLELKLRTYL